MVNATQVGGALNTMTDGKVLHYYNNCMIAFSSQSSHTKEFKLTGSENVIGRHDTRH